MKVGRVKSHCGNIACPMLILAKVKNKIHIAFFISGSIAAEKCCSMSLCTVACGDCAVILEEDGGCTLCAMVLQPYCTFPVNMEHVLAMAAVHDLVEVYAGDTFAYDVKGYEDKAEREETAARRLFGLLPQEQAEAFYALWREFEDCETDDSRFTNAVDRFQPFLNNTATAGHTWRLHDVKRSQVMKRSALSMEVMPVLRPFIEEQVDSAVKKGWLLPG